MVVWSEGEMPGDVSRDAALMAADRKLPVEMSCGRGVLGSGWEEGERKGGGTSRRVRG